MMSTERDVLESRVKIPEAGKKNPPFLKRSIAIYDKRVILRLWSLSLPETLERTVQEKGFLLY